MLYKIFCTFLGYFKNRSSRYHRISGCTVSVSEHVNYLSLVGKIANPQLSRKLLVPVNIAYWQMRFYRLINKLIRRN